jgi:AbrB family looped-hinge helix DNA binding protein
MLTTKLGKRGTIVIPARVRESYGLDEGSQLIVESHPEGVLLRPVVTLPIEIFTAQRKAEFLLNNAVTSSDYTEAVKRVRKMGIDLEDVPHQRPEKGQRWNVKGKRPKDKGQRIKEKG